MHFEESVFEFLVGLDVGLEVVGSGEFVLVDSFEETEVCHPNGAFEVL